MDLGSLNLEDIENIINSMSQSDIQQLSSIANEIFSQPDKEKSRDKDAHPDTDTGADSIDFETVTKIASVISRLSSQPKDPACELLTALKPMLSPERQRKADEAIKLLQIFSLLPILKDLQ